MATTKSLLLDTGIIIRQLRGDKRASELLNHLRTEAELSISVITVTEILIGCKDTNEERAAMELFTHITPTEIGIDVAVDAARLVKAYPELFGRQIGRGIADAYIAATARHHGKSLVSLNTRQFARAPIHGLDVLPIDQTSRSWVSHA